MRALVVLVAWAGRMIFRSVPRAAALEPMSAVWFARSATRATGLRE
jgi:hypothetical protein